jgi:Skp family chaperone for outer membrane proteins
MKKLIVIITLLIMQINFVSANTNIAVIDMDKIINVSKAGTSILNQLNTINDEILIDLKKQEEKLKNKEIKLISQKNILSKSDFDINLKNFKVEIEQYNQNRKKTITDFNIKKEKNTKRFLGRVNKILAEYSDSKSISMVFQKKDLVIAKNELDITDEVIVIIDKNIKDFKIK